jgi:hypothetical protein
VTLGLTTLAFLGQSFMAEPPRCGCFGGVPAPPALDTIAGVVVRNTVLMAAFLWAAFQEPEGGGWKKGSC